AIGIEIRANAPAIVVTMAITIASRGRSTNTDDNTGQLRSACRSHRARSHRRAGSNTLQALNDYQFASCQARIDDDASTAGASGLDAPCRCLAVFHHEYIDAGLIRYQSGLGNYDSLLGVPGFDHDCHQL